MKVLVIHGPNLALLGQREPEIYGSITLDQINQSLQDLAQALGHQIEAKQFDSEGEIVSCIGRSDADAILINPAAYTHTSVAIADALKAANKPAVEVHLSNIYKREKMRHKSLIAPYVLGQISGLGVNSYLLGLRHLLGES